MAASPCWWPELVAPWVPTPPIQREVLPHTPMESRLGKQGGLGELRVRTGDPSCRGHLGPRPLATSSDSPTTTSSV